MNPTRPHPDDFRADINGLRALAVAVVVLYHFDVRGFAGGFVGVDVFFVISGFLMTRIIVRGLANERFSLSSFYAARARRIVPALAVLCAVLLLYGLARLTPPDFERLARHAAASIGFVSNIVYWRDVDYFGATKHDQWLLHTWSLSVEWQFYLLLPVLLMLVARFSRGRPRLLVAAMVAMAVVSFAMSAVLSHTNRIPAFYLLPTRAWEMLAGGLVFLAGPAVAGSRAARLAAPTGLLMIAAAVFGFDEELVWPGWYAALPVLGACLVIWANAPRSVLLGSRPAQFLGDCSYSVYLWHWPLVVVLHQYMLDDAGVWRTAAIAASVLLGHLSLRHVETPARTALARLSLPANGLAFGLSGALVAGVALLVWTTGGLPQRDNVRDYAAVSQRMKFANLGNGWCFVDNVPGLPEGTRTLHYRDDFSRCFVGDPKGRADTLLWGDSHAAHYSPYVSVFAKARGIKVHELSSAACPPLFDTADRGVNPDICARFQQEVRDSLDRYRTIVIAGRWDFYMRHAGFREHVRETLQALTARGAHVVLLGQSPLFDRGIGKQYVYAQVFKRELPERFVGLAGPAEANAVLREAAAQVPGVQYVEPTAGLCDGSGCRVLVDGVPAFYDANHLNIAGAERLAQQARSRGVDLFSGS